MLIIPPSTQSAFLVMTIPPQGTPHDCTDVSPDESPFSFIRAFKYFFSSENVTNHTMLHIGDVEKQASQTALDMNGWFESLSASQRDGLMRYQRVEP